MAQFFLKKKIQEKYQNKKLEFLNLPIKRKLSYILLLNSIAMAFIIFMGFITYDYYAFKKALLNEIKLVSNITKERIKTSLDYERSDLLEDYLESMKAKDSVMYACVFKKDLSLFSYYQRDKTDLPCGESFKAKEGHLFKWNSLEVTVDIGEGRGWLYIVTDLHDIYKQLAIYLVAVGLVFAFIVWCSILLTEKFQFIISQPILSLKSTMNDIAHNNNYQLRVPKMYKDEIGDLADDFNIMIEKVQKRDTSLLVDKEELTSFNLQLAKQVQEKTLQLQEKSDALELTTIDLENSLSVKREFLANMNHEIRTPIHGIKSYVYYLYGSFEKSSLEENKSLIERLSRSTDRLNDLIDRLLCLSKLDSHSLEFNFERHNLRDLVKTIIFETEPMVKDKNMTIIFNYEERQDFYGQMDKGRMLQVVSNLVGNAIKYSPKNTTITINIDNINFAYDDCRTEYSLFFHIQDQGVGIPEGEEKFIFGRFNESSRTKTGAGGTGLGLAITRLIMKAHRGKVWAENNAKGIGSSFYFVMPLTKEEMRY